MTPLNQPDYLGSFNQGMDRGRQRGLSSLMGQAFNAPADQRQNVLAKLAGVDGDAAMKTQQALSQADDDVHVQLAKRAKMVVQLAKSGQQQMAQQAYTAMLPVAQRGGFNGAPAQLTPELLPGLEQLASAMDAQGQKPSGYQEFDLLAKDANLSPEDRAKAARRALYLDRRPSNAAIAYREVKGEDGRTRLVAFDPNEPGAETIGGGQTYGSMGGGDAQPSAMDVAGTLQRFGGTITSGYRDPKKNAQVGGVPNSQHMTGDAFDVVMPPQLKARAVEYGRQSGFEVIDEGDHLHFERQGAQGGPNQFASRTPEEDAAAVERAKLGAQIALAPQMGDADADRAGKVVAAQESAKLDVERRKNEPKLRMALMSAKAKTARLDDAISKAAQQAGFLTTGWTGALTKAIPGTPAHDLSKTLSTIQANIGFDRLQEMRDSSPTGGALGSVTERELEFLQSVYASLEQSQSQEQFLDNLEIVRQATKESWDRVGEAYRQTYGQSQGAIQQPQASSNGGWSIQKVE